jgi:HAD superfamily hydrolase (TIGR01509 family)
VQFERVRQLIGKGSDKLIPELVGRYDGAVAERKKAIFRERFLPGLRPFPGVGDLLEFLVKRGVKLGVASSAGKDELDALLEVAHAKRYFDSTTDADDAQRSKPDPDIVQAALRKLRLPRERCVLIGDTPYDAQAARKAGLGFIGVRCGGLWRDEDLQPAHSLYDGPAELLAKAGEWLTDCAPRTPS